MEIRQANKKKKNLPTNAPGLMDDEMIDTVHNIRIKSHEFREFGKNQINLTLSERCTAI